MSLEENASQRIDDFLKRWSIQNYKDLNHDLGRSVAIRDVSLKFGRCDNPPLTARKRLGLTRLRGLECGFDFFCRVSC